MVGEATLNASTRISRLLEDLEGEFAESHGASRELYTRACELYPGGNTRTSVYMSPFPIYIDSGHGCELRDVDGRTYIDFVNNYTSLIHGHAHPGVAAAIQDAVDKPWAPGAPIPSELGLAALLVDRVPSLERMRFTNSGTEAVLYAIRTARHFTGRRIIAKADGGYHGGAESLQMSVKSSGVSPNEVAEPGVTPSLVRDTIVFPFNDIAGAEHVVDTAGDDLAAIIVEPVQSGAGALPADADFLQALAKMAADRGALLVFDEVMTFRLGYAGVQGELGLRPDLTAMGKIIGGGLPVGAFGGRADVMDVWDPRRQPRAYHAGTFNANGLTLAAGLAAMSAYNRNAVATLNARGDRFRSALDEIFTRHELSMVSSGLGSMGQIHAVQEDAGGTRGDAAPRSFRDASGRQREIVACLRLLLVAHGVLLTPRASWSLSTPLDDEALGAALARVDAAAEELAKRLASP